MLKIDILPVLKDNYAYVLHDQVDDLVAVIDPSEGKKVFKHLQDHYSKLDYIINTHHHWDHVGGNLYLKEQMNCQIVGFAEDQHRIPGIDVLLGDQSTFQFGSHECLIQHIPGHTLGHIALYFKDDGIVFTGDTLFSGGCGRLFEGTVHQMWNSLKWLRSLPDETKVYCGHEYTLPNLDFMKFLGYQTPYFVKYYQHVHDLVHQDKPSIPSTIGCEKRINPFLMCDHQDFCKMGQLNHLDPEAVFAHIRKQKDHF